MNCQRDHQIFIVVGMVHFMLRRENAKIRCTKLLLNAVIK